MFKATALSVRDLRRILSLQNMFFKVSCLKVQIFLLFCKASKKKLKEHNYIKFSERVLSLVGGLLNLSELMLLLRI